MAGHRSSVYYAANNVSQIFSKTQVWALEYNKYMCYNEYMIILKSSVTRTAVPLDILA